MFSRAKTLEYFGLWKKESVEDWPEQFSPHIQILKTPGHDYTGITLFVTTVEGVVAICGDVFWKENYPTKEKRKVLLQASIHFPSLERYYIPIRPLIRQQMPHI